MDAANLQPHQQRVVDERRELNDRLTKLEAFMHGRVYQRLDSAEMARLMRQRDAMAAYSTVLAERIAAF